MHKKRVGRIIIKKGYEYKMRFEAIPIPLFFFLNIYFFHVNAFILNDVRNIFVHFQN